MTCNYRNNLVLFVRIIFTITVISSFVSCSTKKDDNDWTEFNLKGKVKSYREIYYIAVERFGNIEKGNRVRRQIYGIPLSSESYVMFNKKGCKIEVNDYDSDGNLSSKFTYKYDEKGNMIEENHYKSDGNLSRKLTYKYDEKGNMIEENRYDSDGNLSSKFTYKYDEKGNMIEKNYYDSDGSPSFFSTYKYDEEGNKTEESQFEPDGSLYLKTIKTYDKKGNNIEIKNSGTGAIIYYDKISSKYDDKGNLIESIKTRFTQTEVFSYKYDYDKNGNWINRIYFKNDIPKTISEREIEYY